MKLAFVYKLTRMEKIAPLWTFNKRMSLAPTHTTPRGQVVLQPTYFTCSLFVDPAREDINHLIHVYAERYARSPPSQPFLLFKDIWNNEGWTWLHFKVFDARSRDAFLKVTMQLLSGRITIHLLCMYSCHRIQNG